MSTQSPSPTRLLIVGRQQLLPDEAHAAFAHDPTLEIIGHVSSALEATRAARAHLPNVTIVDAHLPDPGALELARFFRLRMPGTRVIFLSRSVSEDDLFQAVRVGAAAYLTPAVPASALSHAIKRVAAGEFLIDEEVMRHPSVASRILSQFRLEASSPNGPGAPAVSAPRPNAEGGRACAPLFVPLSPREIEILDLVARGNSNKLIARRLGISDQTVKNHITTILRKLEVNDRTEAVVHALRNGWIRIQATSLMAPLAACHPAPAPN